MNQKTERKYGAIVASIRAHAKLNKEFTRLDIAHPQNSVAYMLSHMARDGELRIVRKGIPGHGGRPAIYTKA